MVSKIGSKWTMMFNAVPFLAGSAMLVAAYGAESKALIYAGRILTGSFIDFKAALVLSPI